MEKAKDNQEAVVVKNCTIKESSYGSSSVAPTYEIVASSKSKIEMSPKKFKLDVNACASVESAACDVRSLDAVESLSSNQHITIVAKVAVVGESTIVKSQHKELVKQECLLADANSVLRMVLWEEKVGILKAGCSYKLINVNVK